MQFFLHFNTNPNLIPHGVTNTWVGAVACHALNVRMAYLILGLFGGELRPCGRTIGRGKATALHGNPRPPLRTPPDDMLWLISGCAILTGAILYTDMPTDADIFQRYFLQTGNISVTLCDCYPLRG